MADFQITCVTKSGPGYEHITHLGGPALSRRTREEVITMRRAGNRFYTELSGRRAYIEIVEGNPPYLRTVGDDIEVNNLLMQMPCP